MWVNFIGFGFFVVLFVGCSAVSGISCDGFGFFFFSLLWMRLGSPVPSNIVLISFVENVVSGLNIVWKLIV